MSSTFVTELEQIVAHQWQTIKLGVFWTRVLQQPVSQALYHDLMVEMYHYTRHNSMNQAVAAWQAAPEGLLKFVYRHAAEELGHERMITHDLESVGLLDRQALQRPPLPATEALIGYLYYVGLRYGAVARLGYSFWAENVYGQIDEVLQKIRGDLKLNDKNLSFFVAHATIDTKHSQEVKDCLQKYVDTAQDQQQVKTVVQTSLFLTGQLLEQVASLHS